MQAGCENKMKQINFDSYSATVKRTRKNKPEFKLCMSFKIIGIMSFEIIGCMSFEIIGIQMMYFIWKHFGNSLQPTQQK